MAAKSTTTSKKASKVAPKSLKSPKASTKADKTAVTTKKEIAATTKKNDRLQTGLDIPLVTKATEALLKYHQKVAAQKNELLGTDRPIQVQLTLLRSPEKASPKPVRIMIPYPLFSVVLESGKEMQQHLQQQQPQDVMDHLEEAEICLIVKDDECKTWCQGMIEKFPSHMACIKKVLTLPSLRKKHASFEQRRELLAKYNFFMADERILPMLSKALGSDFYKYKKLPIPINLTRKEALPFVIQKALSATYMSLSTGTCVTIRYVYEYVFLHSIKDNEKHLSSFSLLLLCFIFCSAGTTSMTASQLVENICAVATNAVPKLPHKWANIQNISIKTSDSIALPIYSKTPEVLRELAVMAGVVEDVDTPEQEDDNGDDDDKKKNKNKKAAKDSTEGESPNTKKRELVVSPLLRALKKQKQEETKPKDKQTTSKSKDDSTAKESKQKKEKESKSDESVPTKNEADDDDKSVDKSKKVDTPKEKKNNKSPKKDTKTPPKEAKAEKKENTPKSDKKSPAKKNDKAGKAEKDSTPKSSNTKELTDSAENKDFIAAKKFKGSKKGYVFRMGKQGLGYYVDIKPKVDHMAMEALMRSSKNQARRGGQKKNKYKGTRRF